jgi:hypothetical protein
MTKTHTFDWHEENKADSFLAWAVLTVMPSGTKNDTGFFNELSVATDNFTKCELGVTLNGVQIDAEKFIGRLDKAVDSAVEREAKKIIEEMPRLHELHEVLYNFERELKERVIRLANEAGIGLEGEEWDL